MKHHKTPDSSAKSSKLFPTPFRNKKTACNKKPPIYSRRLLLSKGLFQDIERDQEEYRQENCNDFNRSREKTNKKLIPTPVESWYCNVCRKEEAKDMRRCAVCGEYIHEEYQYMKNTRN
ncbi:hypothetical protein PR048_010936 [Dryococelus australis]|uniref:RanBP2-type domain-containing protein n=1 Tax=Dryococelus australis TaxID=614101 RepID=A0ABQ9HKN6_9NEOP|nr:hypothetical protein PR048_010936 [Dryococelus australis]